MALALALAVAVAVAVVRSANIRIEFFADSGSTSRQRGLARFGSLMVFVLFALMAGLSARTLYDNIRFGETSPGIGVPQWWYTLWLLVLSVAMPSAWWACSSAGGPEMIATLLFVAISVSAPPARWTTPDVDREVGPSSAERSAMPRRTPAESRGSFNGRT